MSNYLTFEDAKKMRFSNVSTNRTKVFTDNRNDCAIASLALFEGIAYDQAFDKFSGFYSPRGGCRNHGITKYMSNRYIVTIYGKSSPAKYMKMVAGSVAKAEPKSMSLKTFLENNPTGSFYVIVRGHAITIHNGMVYDTANTKMTARVLLTAKKA